MWEPVPYRLPGVRWDPASAAENITHYVGSQNSLNTVFELECIIQQKMRCAGVVVHSSSVQSVQCIKFVPWENKFIFTEHCGHLKKNVFVEFHELEWNWPPTLIHTEFERPCSLHSASVDSELWGRTEKERRAGIDWPKSQPGTFSAVWKPLVCHLSSPFGSSVRANLRASHSPFEIIFRLLQDTENEKLGITGSYLQSVCYSFGISSFWTSKSQSTFESFLYPRLNATPKRAEGVLEQSQNRG